MTSEVEQWVTVMERFKGGGGNGDELGEETGEEDNVVHSVVDDMRKEGRRETSSDNRGSDGERE